MTWNFCPHCSHRVYQHGSEGCEHVDIAHHPATSLVAPRTERTPCECTVPLDWLNPVATLKR